MKKDIFVDNNIACRFSNPMNPHLKAFVKWLFIDDKSEEGKNRAYLAVSHKLIAEYNSSNSGSKQQTSIFVLMNKLTREGRLVFISNDQIKAFKKEKFKKHVIKKMLSNKKDWDHIPVVMLSNRKYALTNDDNFKKDLKNFPGYNATVEDSPEKIPYN